MIRTRSPFRPLRLLTAFLLALAGAVAAAPALATCLPVAGLPQPRILPAHVPLGEGSLGLAPPARIAAAARGPALPAGMVEITFLGHASFLIRTPGNIAAVTDYNGYNRAPFAPDIVTMNRAHSSHYTEAIEPGVAHVLRGWDDVTGMPYHDLRLGDMRVRNVPTNIRDGAGGTRFAGNSIFIFEAAGLCIAHVGHLHHPLTPEHLGQIGEVDVIMVPIDDGLTMPQTRVAEVVAALRPKVVIPMHYFGHHQVQGFLDLLKDQGYEARFGESATVRLARRTLPRRTVLVLPGEG